MRNPHRDSSIKLIQLLSLLLLMGACGRSGDSQNSTIDLSYERSEPTPDEVSESVYCADDDCPESVGVLGIYDGSQKNQEGKATAACTAFLISPDVVATNSHCIPESIRFAGASCSEKLAIIFPRVGSAALSKEICDEVLYASPHIENGYDPAQSRAESRPDIAFFKIKHPSSRRLSSISSLGVPSRSKLRSYVGTHYWNNGVLSSRIDRLSDCTSIANTTALPDYKDEASGMIALVNCPVIHGNSGSPLFNEKSEIVALIQNIYSQTKTDTNSKGEVVLANSFRCIDTSQISNPLITSKDCLSQYFSMSSLEIRDWSRSTLLEGLKAAENKLEAHLNANSTLENSAFLWAIQIDKNTKYLQPSEDIPLPLVKSVVRGIPVCKLPAKTISSENWQETMPFWTINVGLGKNLEKIRSSESSQQLTGFTLKSSGYFTKTWIGSLNFFDAQGAKNIELSLTNCDSKVISALGSNRVIRMTEILAVGVDSYLESKR